MKLYEVKIICQRFLFWGNLTRFSHIRGFSIFNQIYVSFKKMVGFARYQY